jgi:hypothetical protein
MDRESRSTKIGAAMQYFKREWLADGRVLCYRFVQNTREAADAWYYDIAAVLAAWPEERPLHTLLDVHTSGRILGRHALVRARQVSYMRPSVSGRTAVLIASSRLAQLISAALRGGLAPHTRERRIFGDEPSALDWLLQEESPLNPPVV